MSNLVYFAHGKESGPWGDKIQHLAAIAKACGFEVESPDYSFTKNQEERVEMLLALNPQADNLILVGSSMGGYVSAVASDQLKPDGLFLMAPAFYVPFYNEQNPKPYASKTIIVHGENDEIIPVSHSKKYADEYDVELHVLNSDHRLKSAITDIGELFKDFLNTFVMV